MHDYLLSFVGMVPTTAAPHALERREPAPGTAGTVGAGPHSLGDPWVRKAVRASPVPEEAAEKLN